MAVKIYTNQKPKVDTYLIPPGVRTLDYEDFDWTERVTIPRIEPEIPRTATRIMLGSGEVIFVIDKEVEADEKGFSQQVSQLFADSTESYAEWLAQRAEREGVPDVAEMEAQFLHSRQCYVYTWKWWEVSW